MPPIDDVVRAADNGVRTYLLAVWDELPEETSLLSVFDKVICPYRGMKEQLDASHLPAVRLPNTVYLPWDVSFPICNPFKLQDPPVVLLPLIDSQWRRNEADVLTLAETAMLAGGKVVLLQSNSLPEAKKGIRKLATRFHDRFSVISQPTMLQIISIFGSTDLVLWPARREGMAILGLWSLCMGSPVVAWDIPPQNEYLVNDVNSALVPASVAPSRGRIEPPSVTSSYADFGVVLRELLGDRDRLVELKQHSSDHMLERRKAFHTTWARLFGPAIPQ